MVKIWPLEIPGKRFGCIEPALDSQGYVHVSYAWTPPGKNQRQIKHIVMDLSKVTE